MHDVRLKFSGGGGGGQGWFSVQSDLFSPAQQMEISPSHPPQYLLGICVYTGKQDSTYISSLDFSIPQSFVQTLEFGIVLRLSIVRIVQE